MLAVEIYEGTIETENACERFAISEKAKWYDDMPVVTEEILDTMIAEHEQMLSDLQQIKREQFGG